MLPGCYLDILWKGKLFFSDDIMLLVGSPCFANILLLLNIFQYIGTVISSEKNLPLAAVEGSTKVTPR